MDATKQWDVDRRKESFGTPLPGAPNVGFRVPAKPLRFKHWGAHEDFPLSILTLYASSRSLGLTKRNHNIRDTRFILVQVTIVV